MPSPGAPLSPRLRVSTGLKLSEELVCTTKQMFPVNHYTAIHLSGFADPPVHTGAASSHSCCERSASSSGPCCPLSWVESHKQNCRITW